MLSNNVPKNFLKKWNTIFILLLSPVSMFFVEIFAKAHNILY